MTTMQSLPTSSRAHPFLADAAGWGLSEDHLTVIHADGAAPLLLLGSLGAAGTAQDPAPEALAASFQLDAGDLPGIGPRSLFAGQLRLVFEGAAVVAAQALRLEWRGPTTLFTDIPAAIGEDGAPAHEGDAARIAALVTGWARGAAATAVLAAAAASGAEAAVQAAVMAKDTAIRNNRAAQAQAISPNARAHHLWWAARREEEARRHATLAARLGEVRAALVKAAGDAAG